MKKTLLALCLPAFCLSSQSQDYHPEALAKAEATQAVALREYDAKSMASNNFDVTFYRCQWTVNPAVRQIAGSVTTYFTITTSASNITFDLAAGLTVDSVLFRGSATGFVRNLDALQINFPNTLPIGQKDSVQVFYRGVPPAPSQGYFTAATHSGVPVLWTLSEPYGARTWWPCKDVLTDKPDSISIAITHPSAYVSSSIGLPVSETVSGGNRTTHWRHGYPIVPYLVAFAVTNYAVENDAVQTDGRTLPVSLYAYPENLASFRTATATAKFCLQRFSPLLSDYPFGKERYAQTQFGVGGGMEHQTNSFLGSPHTGLVAHELAHQWFGDKITCGSWGDLWLNEGFASYMEYVYTELTNPAARANFLRTWSLAITAYNDGSVYVRDTLNISRLFDSRLTYRKAGYAAHMLRWKLGDSAFFRGLRRYLNDPALAYRHALTADLRRNLETESGKPLGEFFNDWIYGEGHPDYIAEWSVQDTNVQVRLNQVTSHPSVNFFEMPVPLQFKAAGKDTTVRVEHTQNGQVFSLALGFVPDALVIDPQLHILSRNKTVRKVTAIAPPATGFSVYPNPVRGLLTVKLPAVAGAAVRVFDAIGRTVYSAGAPADKAHITTTGWASGVYWVEATGNGYREVKKVVVNR